MEGFLRPRGLLEGRYLDVASCYGWFVGQMAERGMAAEGIERDPLGATLGRLVYGVDPDRIRIGDVVDVLRGTRESWDVVSCFSLLHHFVLGRGACDEVELIRLDPQYHLVFEAGGELQANGDMARLAEEVARLSPADARALPRFMADNRAKFAAFRPALESAFHDARAFARPALMRALPKLRPHRTVDSDLATYFKDPRVRLAFSFQS